MPAEITKNMESLFNLTSPPSSPSDLEQEDLLDTLKGIVRSFPNKEDLYITADDVSAIISYNQEITQDVEI